MIFTHRFRTRYAEVDMQKVVFNGRYLEYADLLITEYWREIDLHFSGDNTLEFHTVRAAVDYVAPIRADEWIDGRVWTEKVGNTSVTTQMELHGATEDGFDDLRARIELVHVHVDLESGRPVPVPDWARPLLLAEK
jgi:acyl-CoA thioester hydrolase